ncbi:MAG: DUF1292 domain-containing protein [Blautia sp.]|nr:DUF1292 domain-containing protein [Blautia sp.]
MGKDFEDDIEEVELDAVTIPDEQGVEHEYAIIANFFLGDRDYVALSPIRKDGMLEEETVLFYRCQGDEEDLELEDIESAEELALVMETYEELCSEEDED